MIYPFLLGNKGFLKGWFGYVSEGSEDPKVLVNL
jgi:hypothetical protein